MLTTKKLLRELNAIKGKAYPDMGYNFYADVRGDGQSLKSVYRIIGAGGGVAYSQLNGRTPRETCAKIRQAIGVARAAKAGTGLGKLQSFAVIILAIGERGEIQFRALAELERRELWLSADQKKQGGLV